MKKILMSVAAAMTLAIAGPAAASSSHAEHGSHESHKPAQHHGKTKHGKARHAKTKHFHSKPGTTDPRAPGAVSVASFVDGTLTLTLADGSTVSGAVAGRTHIGCVPARSSDETPASAAMARGKGDRGDDDRGDDEDENEGGDENEGEDRPNACTTANLVAGTIVHQAILKIRGGVATFKLVLLVKRPAA